MGSFELPNCVPDELPQGSCARIVLEVMHEVQIDLGSDVQPGAEMTEHVLENNPHVNFHSREDNPETLWWCERYGRGVCNFTVLMEGGPNLATFTTKGRCTMNRRLREAFARANKETFGDARGWDQDEVE
jgi:hypothetical protein